jgi:hypothetical protein
VATNAAAVQHDRVYALLLLQIESFVTKVFD